MTKPGYGMTASPEMNRYLHAHFRDLGRTTSVSCKHAVAFRGKIRRTALDGVLYLRPQTSSCGICLIKKKKKHWNVSVFDCNSNHIHASDPRSQAAEGLQEGGGGGGGGGDGGEADKKKKEKDCKRKECVEAKCFDKYFVLVCVTADTITGPETLPSSWITHKANQHCPRVRRLQIQLIMPIPY